MVIDPEELHRQDAVELIDVLFARTIVRLSGSDDPYLGLAAALVSHASGQGHVCLDLNIAGRDTLDQFAPHQRDEIPLSAVQWREHLEFSGAVGRPGDFRPLILDGHRLYLHRFWHYEHDLAQSILQRCREVEKAPAQPLLIQSLETLFGDQRSAQYRAAHTAVTQRFSVISGGPGSGKTYTIARIIVLLQLLAGLHPLRIWLAAPTGKAAARLQEAVDTALKDHQNLAGSTSPDGFAGLRPARTLHRLLGYSPSTGKFSYTEQNLLSADAVIVDEASMVDLKMMASLMCALPPQTHLILVGDKDQLASVEAGAVLGDICFGHGGTSLTAHPAPDLQNAITVLDKTYRFDQGGGIAALSRAINCGDDQKAKALLSGAAYPELEFRSITDRRELLAALAVEIVNQMAPLFQTREPGAALACLNRFRILAVVRQGPFGVNQLNAVTEAVLRRHGWIEPGHETWYPLRPVIIGRNDYSTGLFNGDVGITLKRQTPPHDPELEVAFADALGGFSYFAPHQLPVHETVYAMTVHKSQGSEFERVVLILPDQDGPLLTRELLYTAVTRARGSVAVWGDLSLVAAAVRRRIRRASGLREALWGAPG